MGVNLAKALARSAGALRAPALRAGLIKSRPKGTDTELTEYASDFDNMSIYTASQSEKKDLVGQVYKSVYHFHQLGSLGHVGLVVTKSLCVLSVCPLPMQFFLRPLIGPVIT